MILICLGINTGADPGFFKGGLEAMVIYKLYYIYILQLLIHIIILNEVHCILLKAIDA